MKIVIKRADGGVSIMELLAEAAEAASLAPEHLDVIIQAEIAQWPEEQRNSVVSWSKIDDASVPQDRMFRAAWKASGESIEHDMVKCRDIWRDFMRTARAPKLAALDVEFQRSLETGKSLEGVIAAKQSLRDVTKNPGIEAAQTPDELRAIWPEVLS